MSIKESKVRGGGSERKVQKKSDHPKSECQSDPPLLITEITNLRLTFNKRHKAHRKAIRSDIVEAVEIGLKMRSDPEKWAYFCKLSWETKGPKVNQIEQAVRFSIKYMVGPGTSAQKKASFYYNAVSRAVDAGLRGAKLKKLLKDKGLKNLADENSKYKKQAPFARNKSKTVVLMRPSKKLSSSTVSERDDVGKETEDKTGIAINGKPQKGAVDWPVILRFKNLDDRLTNLKIGEKVRMTVKVNAFGKASSLVVTKTKILKKGVE